MAQFDHKRNHLGIFGGSGTGKTTYAIRAITGQSSECVFIFDPDGEFSHKLGVNPALTAEGIDIAIETGWVCFDPSIMFEGELEDALEWFCVLVMAYSKKHGGRKFFVVDELGTYISGSKIPKPLKAIVQTGRRYGIDCVFMGQQPNELHNTVRTQLSEVVCFRLADDNALEFPIKRGFDEAEIRNLPDYQWVCRDDKGNEARS